MDNSDHNKTKDNKNNFDRERPISKFYKTCSLVKIIDRRMKSILDIFVIIFYSYLVISLLS